MMRSFLLLAVVSTVLVVSVFGKKVKSRCRFSQQILPEKIAKFDSECLNKGFQESTMDCTGNMDTRMKRTGHFRKCSNLDKYLRKCGYTCKQCGAGVGSIHKAEECELKRWRSDGRCGRRYPLPDGTEAECDPDSEKPCCGDYGLCGNRDDQCNCPDCTDYRIVRKIAKSGNSCTVAAVGGFLKNVCANNETKSRYHFKCMYSDVYYESYLELDRSFFTFAIDSVSAICNNDPHVYQACGFNTQITNTDVLCGGYFCQDDRSTSTYSFSTCEDNCGFHRECSRSQTEADSGIVEWSATTLLCDGKCDDRLCEDEGWCNGLKYGVFCARWGQTWYIPAHRVCDGYAYCDNGEDEQDCSVSDSTPYTCLHYGNMLITDRAVTVPILNYTRCSVFDGEGYHFPYCFNYLDQTNCSDPERVGGYCHVNGFMSSVSKYVVCLNDSNICDDGMENVCILPSFSGSCRIHKHRMCDGVYDCPDQSDEYHDMCHTMTEAHKCHRTFGSGTRLPLPVTWLMDNETDCLDGLDERWNDGHHSKLQRWMFCGDKDSGTFRVKLNYDNTSCQDVFQCPRGAIPYVGLDLLCDWAESCGLEYSVCQIARDFNHTNTSVPYHGSVKDVCRLEYVPTVEACHVREMPTRVGVFGLASIFVNVPVSKVDCNNIFGESYVFLSCMGLCLHSDCPLDNINNPLLYDSCPGQFPNRIYTLANNSYLTFVTETYPEGQYEQNYFQCKNSRCVEYKQVCDLIDDCGDFSDEINCTNHQIFEHTVGSNKKQLIPYRMLISRTLLART